MAAEKTAEKKKGKKKTKGDAGAASEQPSVAASIRRRPTQSLGPRAWGGLAGFLIAGYLSLPTSTLAEAGLRALVAGSICYVAAWAGALFVWRRMVMVELRNREQQQISEI